ncbi:MAG: hypothetical protein H6765_06205 [Candidatus Peribacteria bacterium]|nr:MAG: hypothetical protein H6765_06205 [Candidatus Peribacteria bacterium]
MARRTRFLREQVLEPSVARLSRIYNNPRLAPGLKAKVEDMLKATKQLAANFTPENLNGYKIMQSLQLPAVSNPAAYNKLVELLETSKEFRTALKAARDEAAVKALFSRHGITDIDDWMIARFAKNKNVNLVTDLDLAIYGRNYASVSKFSKMLSHPATRVLGRALSIVLFGVEVYNTINIYNDLTTEEKQAVEFFKNELQGTVISAERKEKLIV